MEVLFNEDLEGSKASTKKASEGSYVMKDAVLVEFKNADGTIGKIRAPCEGVVTYSRDVQRGAILSKGKLIAKVSECDHAIVIKDMCGTCGKDLREKGGRAGQRKEQSAANVSMIHNVPELIVSDTLAKELGNADETNLLANRKLVLLVDLDQTIIHTTNRPFNIDPEKHPDITQYTLMNGNYVTKLRPHTTEFLHRMSKLFELHIVTYGQRQYAHKIAQILDPDQRLFGHRILSRDELFSAQHKTKNLKALFPCGEKLVVIIDDRADVWMYSEALIQIKPYRFFKEVGDINAPKDSKEQMPPEIEDSANEDHVLEEIERVLTNIHDKYYEMYDLKNPDAPLIDVKSVINDQRRKVLEGCVIVLSGIVPINEKVEKTDVYRLCEQFGAKMADTVTDDVTHVVGVRWGTTKVHQALRLGKHVVTVHWVYACVEKWLKADEKEFELTNETSAPIGKPLGSQLVSDLANMSTIGKSALADMNHEVDEALSDDDDEEEEEEEEIDEEEMNLDEMSNVVEESLTPRSEESRKRKHVPEEEYNSDGDNDDDDDDETPMSYSKLLSKSKKQGRIVSAGNDEEDLIFDVDDENGHPSDRPGPSATETEEDDEDDDEALDDDEIPPEDDDEEFEDMAALIERQVSHNEED
ncbi:unnamed protein product [Caenorhabditis bovis]|uniref:RNA polymerase II subunit A C-terminal domain phosphatase n=1 Tax=Caenorhabditis bovis TaxID=2654633 RepID=A0A8S1F4N2_9PELO|nr:unnamed protein product [Caenorhabditis bovis]